MNYRMGIELSKVSVKVGKDGVKAVKREDGDQRRRRDRRNVIGVVRWDMSQCKRAPAKREPVGIQINRALCQGMSEAKSTLNVESKDFARVISTNVVQPVELPKPCVIRVKITAADPSELCKYVVDVMIDSGSPISAKRRNWRSLLGEY